MKHLLLVIALIFGGCASLDRKCSIEQLPPSPTHEELIAQEIVKTRTASAEKSWDKEIKDIRPVGQQALTISRKETVCINRCDIVVIRATSNVDGKDIANMYWILEYMNDDKWEPIGLYIKPAVSEE